ncbi:MAG: hypothetical protein ABW321_16570, partial [Polyangiales bacterium]
MRKWYGIAALTMTLFGSVLGTKSVAHAQQIWNTYQTFEQCDQAGRELSQPGGPLQGRTWFCTSGVAPYYL